MSYEQYARIRVSISDDRESPPFAFLLISSPFHGRLLFTVFAPVYVLGVIFDFLPRSRNINFFFLDPLLHFAAVRRFVRILIANTISTS